MVILQKLLLGHLCIILLKLRGVSSYQFCKRPNIGWLGGSTDATNQDER